MNSFMHHARLWLIIGLLFTVGLAYHTKGLILLFRESGGVDLRLRWSEQHYVFAGQNPYDITYSKLGIGNPPWNLARNVKQLANVDIPDSGGYPPWAFAFGYLAFWPPWSVTKTYFTVISSAFLACTCYWAYLQRCHASKSLGALLAASVFAIGAHSTTIHVGQYGNIVVGCLAASHYCLACNKNVLGGIFLGLAMLKPTVAGPFFLVLLVTANWQATLSCISYVLLASMFIWQQTATSPVEMFLQSTAAAAEFVHDESGLVGTLLAMGISAKKVTPFLAVSVLVPTGIALAWLRRMSLLDQFAVASVGGRFWAYHKHYDNMMLMFLLIALGCLAVDLRSRVAWCAFAVVGISLWLPASVFRHEGALAVQMIVWLVGIVCLVYLRNCRQDTAQSGNEPTLGEELRCRSLGVSA